MRGDGACPMATDGGKEFFSILKIRFRQHAAILPQPRHFSAVKWQTALRPSGRVGASKQEHQILHNLQWQVMPKNLECKKDKVRVVKKVEVHVRNMKKNRFG